MARLGVLVLALYLRHSASRFVSIVALQPRSKEVGGVLCHLTEPQRPPKSRGGISTTGNGGTIS
jgi:hypothetical protein